MATVLFIGDPHFQVTNMSEANLFTERVIALAKEKEPTFIVIAGDVLHTHERLHTLALNKACEFIDEMRLIAETFVLVGNHDMINNQQFLTDNHWMNGLKEWENLTIVDRVVQKTVGDDKFLFVPYVPNGRFVEALDTCDESWVDAKCIFAHQEFSGCKMGAIISVDGDTWPLGNPHVVSGHIHSRQRPQKNVYYSGSAMQHAFGESERNIVAYLMFNGGSMYDIEEIDLSLPRKKIVYMDVAAVDDYVLPETEDKIKVTVSGVYDQFKAFKKTRKYKDLVDKGVKVVFKPQKIRPGEKVSELVDTDETSFKTILSSIVTKQKDPFLFQSYELVVNNKDIDHTDVLFL